MRAAIEVNNLSKLYRLGEVGTGTLTHDLKRWVAKVRGHEDPYSKVGQVNDRTQRAEKDEYVWALSDLNFKVEQGDVVGIIGRNGAGKSTLLKILSRITAPTTGEVKIKGRIASLLEVGTGFHPELTGRENVYMNGTIMGMRKYEIARKFDEIVDFAGVAKYIDTPVKRYSSGMMVRLGFAVAAFLEPEILIVDEVLAVGDAEFQKKALGKMRDVSRGEGRTVLFVSHNMSAIRQLCNNAVLLNNGSIETVGQVEDVIRHYFQHGFELNEKPPIGPYRVYDISDSPVVIEDIYVVNEKSNFPTLPLGLEPEIVIKIKSIGKISNANVTISLFTSEGIKVGLAFSWDDNFYLNTIEGSYNIVFKLKGNKLPPGEYYIGVGINQSTQTVAWDGVSLYPIFKIQDQNNIKHFNHRSWGVSHFVDNSWEISKI